MPANRTETGRFEKGCSGNPSGRPKRTETEREMLNALYDLAPVAVDRIRALLENDKTPANIQLKCAEIILQRVAGKPMAIDRMEENEREREDRDELDEWRAGAGLGAL